MPNTHKKLEQLIKSNSLKHDQGVGQVPRQLVNKMLAIHHRRREVELELELLADEFRGLWHEAYDYIERRDLKQFMQEHLDDGDNQCLINLDRIRGVLVFQDPEQHDHNHGKPKVNVIGVPINLGQMRKMMTGDLDFKDFIESIPFVDTSEEEEGES